MKRDTFDRLVIAAILVFYLILFEAWLIIAPDASWSGVELVFMTIPILTIVIIYDLWIGFVVTVILGLIYIPAVWPLLASGRMSLIELIMKFILIGALAVGAAMYKDFEERRRERIRRLADRLQKKVEQQKNIINAQQALGANLELAGQLESFLHWSSRLVDARAGYVAIYDRDRKKIVYALSDDAGEELPAPFRRLIGRRKHQFEQDDIDKFVREMQGQESSVCVPLKVRKENLGALCLTPEPGRSFSEEDFELISMLGVKAAIAIENAKLHELNMQLYVDSIRALAKIINTRDPLTKDHSDRVAHMAGRLARHIGLRGRPLSNVVLAADLHDIGRIIIPDAILKKPGPLTKKEFDIVKEHPEAGYDLLQGIRALKDVLPGIRHHHERFDGKGYPHGLSGEDIPLIARIIAVADIFEALTSARSHRGAVSYEEAAAVLVEVSGSQLDPKLVDAFLATYKLNGEAVKNKTNKARKRKK
ncbi:MAG: HD domain-containing phosphohydrolase [Actinomycetota bacterium]